MQSSWAIGFGAAAVVTGHRAPMRYLDELIRYMKSKPGVWFATGERIARYVSTVELR